MLDKKMLLYAPELCINDTEGSVVTVAFSSLGKAVEWYLLDSLIN